MKLLPADATWGWAAFAVLFAVLGWYHTTYNLSISLTALPHPAPPPSPIPHKLVEKFSVAAQLLFSFDLSLARAFAF
jgi:hypothetical protein